MRRWMQTTAALAGTFAAASSLSAPSGSLAVTNVTVTDLGTFGGTDAVAWDVNDAGFIVGWATTPAGARHAFYFRANTGTLYDIDAASSIGGSEARGINNLNHVVGYTLDSQNGTRAFRWFATLLTMLNDAAPSGAIFESSAVAISDAGHIVGQRRLARGGATEATLWSDDMTHHTLSAATWWRSTYVSDVNEFGQAVGSETSGSSWRWQWTPAGTSGTLIPQENMLPTDALGINGAGDVVGFQIVRDCCWVDVGHVRIPQGRWWDAAQLTRKRIRSSYWAGPTVAEDINDAGYVAGYGDAPTGPGSLVFFNYAFIYHDEFKLVQLPPLSPGMSNCRAHALNERNRLSKVIQVVGYCENAAGRPRAVRWDVTVGAASLPSPFGP